MVAQAANAADPDSASALAQLCEAYWYPLYVFSRRQGESRDDAQDLVQGFLSRIVDKQDLGALAPERGRFRTWLLASFKHYAQNARDHNAAAKRGGCYEILSLDFADAESRYGREPSHLETPEKAYQRRWVLLLLQRVLHMLEEEFCAEGKLVLFETLKPTLTADGTEVPYRQMAVDLGMSESAIKVAVHRLRRRYGDLLREEVAQTLVNPADVRAEITFLLTALS